MKNFKLTNLLTGVALLASMVFLSNCKSSDDPGKPTATFTYVADNKVVTFTNTSTNATSYSWNFGDGTTSTETSPVHTYSAFGQYTVTLSSTGSGGTANSVPDQLTLAKSSPVVIDGNVSEWSDIPTVEVPETFGTITSVKIDYDGLNMYFLVQGTADLGGFLDVYLNTDGNPHTGYFSGWYPKGYGADFLVEGDFTVNHDAVLFQKPVETDSGTFDFAPVAPEGSNVIKSSSLVTVGSGKAIEFSIVRSAFTNLADVIYFAIVDVNGITMTTDSEPHPTRDYEPTWATMGSIPKDNTPEGKLLEFDLTK